MPFSLGFYRTSRLRSTMECVSRQFETPLIGERKVQRIYRRFESNRPISENEYAPCFLPRSFASYNEPVCSQPNGIAKARSNDWMSDNQFLKAGYKKRMGAVRFKQIVQPPSHDPLTVLNKLKV